MERVVMALLTNNLNAHDLVRKIKGVHVVMPCS
jgi:hypothetical protein